MKKETTWTKLRGDGGTQPCSPERLTLLKEEFKQLGIDAGDSVNDRRQMADDTRFCRWPGQSPDGKKHKDAKNGKAAFPFEGASDKRERTADGITNEQVIIIMAALMRLNITFSGVPGENGRTNDKLSGKLNALWEWVKRNQLGVEWFVEWTKFAQWRQGDSPAVGIMQVFWHQQRAVKPVTVSAQDVVDLAFSTAQAQEVALAPEDELDLVDMVVNPERADELADLLQTLWVEMRDTTARKAASELLADGEATFPVPYVCENRLRIKARRLFDNIFVPENTPSSEFNRRARVIFTRDWYSEVELRERDAAGDFKAGFLEEVLKHEGESGWVHLCHTDDEGGVSEDVVTRTWDKKKQRGLYELITATFKAANAQGVPGVYMVEYHHAVELAGTDMELVDYALAGRLPFVASPRELISDKLWESRGNSELSATEQNALKLLHDSFMDHAQLTTVPPLEVPASRPKMALVWGPLKQIRMNRPGEIKPIQSFQYPAANDKAQKAVQEGLARYFGQISESNPPDLVRLYNQSLVDFMMLPVSEVMWMGIKLAQQYLPDETLQEILGEHAPAGQLERDVLGEFHVEANFEAAMLSLDYLKLVGEMVTNFLLPWDTEQTIPRAELVKWFFGNISPTIANRLVRPVEEANQSEIDDEEGNFGKIAAGIEPPMMQDGQNYALRRATLLGIGEKNPEAFQKLTPVSRLILEARLKHFDGMLEQQKNAVIGRTMAAPALAGAATPAA